jgi:uncharacterized membrane protein
MATIQQSIDIKVPAHTVYNQLTQFEDYPNFLADVETVQQLDDTHLHWTMKMAKHRVEWDMEITEQEPDRSIAWRNVGEPMNTGKVEVQPAGPETSRVIFTLESEQEQVTGSTPDESEAEMSQRLQIDLAHFKDFIEARGSATGAWRGEVHDGRSTARQRGAGPQERQKGTTHSAEEEGRSNAPVPTSSYAAGSEGFTGNEEPAAPVVSAPRTVVEQRNDSAGSVSEQQSPLSFDTAAPGSDVDATMQSDYSLSRSSGAADDGRFSVAEEVNWDQQSDAVRHVGQMPQDTHAERHGGAPASDAAGKPEQKDR